MKARARGNYASHVTRTPRIPGLDASAQIRLAFVVLSGLLAVNSDAIAEVLPWMLLVLVLDLVDRRARRIGLAAPAS